MSGAKTSKVMSTGLAKVVERARNHPQERILSLAHRIDVSALERAYGRLRDDAAVGVDGVQKRITDRTWRAISRACTSGCER